MKIHELDAKILKILLLDGRKSFTDIAQECGTTKNQVWKRYKLMENEGIIMGVTAQIDFDSLGYETIAKLLISVEAQEIEHALEYISKMKEVHAYRQYNSLYNIRAVAALKSLDDLEHIKAAIRRQLPITALKTYLWTGIKNIPENLQLVLSQKNTDNTEQKQNAITLSPKKKVKIDALDMQIIEKLILNGRVPFSKIAEEIGTSTDTVLKRYQKLNGIVKVVIQINPSKLGYRSVMDFSIAFNSPASSSAVVEHLARIPDVVIITKTSGDYDLQLTAMIRDIEHMFTLQEKVIQIAGVTKIETSVRKIPDKWPTPRQSTSTL